MSTTQDYTITAAAPTQPTSASYEVAILDPVVTISGIEADEAVVIRISQDGSDPAAGDRAIVVTRKDAQGGTWKEKVTVKAGNKMVFIGDRLTSGSSITVQVEAS